MSILVLNAGSSTLKFALFDHRATAEFCHGLVAWKGQSKTATLILRPSGGEPQQSQTELADYGDAVECILRSLFECGFHEPVQAVGHRVVHGGTDFRESVLIDEKVDSSLRKISKLAPLHHPPVITTYEAMKGAIPNIPQVAVFDTSYFSELPERASVYPVPYEWYERYGIHRFGFHGISHQYCAMRGAGLLNRQGDETLRLIVCHLGNGCSVTSVLGGKPMMNTMGFTPLEGLMMGTRSGSIDPGILIYLMQEHGFDAARFEDDLNRRSGLLGVSGVSSDYREVEQAASVGNLRARLAIEMFTDRVRSTIGSLAVALRGVDGLIFTGGIGENSATLRSQVCNGLECLDMHLNEDLNNACHADADIANSESRGRILVLHTREEQIVALETRRVCAEHSNG